MPTPRLILALVGLALLAACGADGPPSAPGTEVGVTLSGQIKAGVAGGS